MEKQTTDQQIITLTWSKVIPIVIGLLVATNTVTGLIFQQERNTEDIHYNYERNNRKSEADMEETKQLLHILKLEEEVQSLKDHIEINNRLDALEFRVGQLEVEGSDSK